MTRVLVTGPTSRQCNPAKNKRDVMISWMIAEICRDLGYEVEQRNPTLEETYEDFDHVFIGMAPLHGLGSNRTYGTLAAYLRNYESKKVTLYLDDVNTRNVSNGLRTLTANPNNLLKPFYWYRLEYEKAVLPEYRDWLQFGVKVLSEYEWPTTLVPAFQWADLPRLTRALPMLTKPVGLDYTAYLPDYTAVANGQLSLTPQWVTESDDDKWLDRQRVGLPVHRYGKGYNKRPTDEGLVREYASSWGVLDRGHDDGWWTSRIGYAAQARTVYSTKWQNVEALGESYTELPENIERMSDEDAAQLVSRQADALDAGSESRASVRDKVKLLVEGETHD